MHLHYLAFGTRSEIHYQANFSILTFLKQKRYVDSITVITDQPAFYKLYAPDVACVAVDQKTLQAWRGPHDYFWRIKLKALESIVQRHVGEPIAYLDSDTFLFNDAAPLRDLLGQGKAMMHEKEGALSQSRTKTEQAMWRRVRGRVYGGVKITADHAMWNAGTVIVPGPNNAEAIALALSICDEMWDDGIDTWLIEQFATSVALQTMYDLQPVRSWIAHYWGNKNEWNNLIATFYATHRLKNSTVQEEISSLDDFNFAAVPVRCRRSAAHRKLTGFLDGLYPMKNIVYIK